MGKEVKRKKKPVNSNQKGKRIERKVANRFRDKLGLNARRSQQYCGAGGNSDIIVEQFPHAFIEVKGGEMPGPTSKKFLGWVAKIVEQSPSGWGLLITWADGETAPTYYRVNPAKGATVIPEPDVPIAIEFLNLMGFPG